MTQISPNIFIDSNADFGDYHQRIVHGIFQFVDVNMSLFLGKEPFTSRKCIITRGYKNPMISRIDNYHLIRLNVEGDYWCKWLYQFAHEYCHHFIDGDMTGELKGLVWFEETLCEASSIYSLLLLKNAWKSECHNSICHQFVPALHNYIEDLTNPATSNITSLSDLTVNGFYSLTDTGEIDYYRDLYHRIAVSLLLPKMIQNPFLWRIVHHIGDSRKWVNLGSLMEHLVEMSDLTYRNTIIELYNELDSLKLCN